MIPLRTVLLAIFVATALGASGMAQVASQAVRTWTFAEDGVAFRNDFSGARLNECERLGPREYRVTTSPENAPINPSPWYAFKIEAQQAGTVTLWFHVTEKGSIVRPRLSRDGKTWEAVSREAFTPPPKPPEGQLPADAKAVLQLEAGTTWCATQEIIGLEELGAWMDAKAQLSFAREKVIGESIEHRPLRQLVFAETEQPNYVFIISRQHPPEVTGTLALMSFLDTVTGSGELAQRYRRAFQTVVVPMMNPDGIEHGHWRHNLGGVDTNRDWKAFTQPETRAARDAMLALGRGKEARVFLFLDFHSTGHDVFYCQPDTAATFPRAFTSKWLGAIAGRFPGYSFDRDDKHNVGAATSKSWAYDTFGCPGITYELGYETERPLIRDVAAGAAEEMMRLLLEEVGAK